MKTNKRKIGGLFLFCLLAISFVFLFGCGKKDSEEAWESFQIMMDALTGGRDNWSSVSHDYSSKTLTVSGVEIKDMTFEDAVEGEEQLDLAGKGRIETIKVKGILAPKKLNELIALAAWSDKPSTKLTEELVCENVDMSFKSGPIEPMGYKIKSFSVSDLTLKAAGKTDDIGPLTFMNATTAGTIQYDDMQISFDSKVGQDQDPVSGTFLIGSLFAKKVGFGGALAEKYPDYKSQGNFSADELTLKKVALDVKTNEVIFDLAIDEIGAFGVKDFSNVQKAELNSFNLKFQNQNPSDSNVKDFDISVRKASLSGLDYTDLFMDFISSDSLAEGAATAANLLQGSSPLDKLLAEPGEDDPMDEDGYDILGSLDEDDDEDLPLSVSNLGGLFSYPFSLESSSVEDLTINADNMARISLNKVSFDGPFKRNEVASVKFKLDGLSLFADPNNPKTAKNAATFTKYLGSNTVTLNLDYSATHNPSAKTYTYSIDRLEVVNNASLQASLTIDDITQKTVDALLDIKTDDILGLLSFVSNSTLGIKGLEITLSDKSVINNIAKAVADETGSTPQDVKPILGMIVGIFIQDEFGNVLSQDSLSLASSALSDFISNPGKLNLSAIPQKTLNFNNIIPFMNDQSGLINFMNFKLSVNNAPPIKLEGN